MLFRTRCRHDRRGVACVELAVLLPILTFLFLVAVDFARVFYQYTILADCARNGALYGSQDAAHSVDTTGIQNAALSDATDISPNPNVTSATGTDSNGNPYVEATVTWTFHTVSSYLGMPSTLQLSRTVQMRVAPLVPKNS
jgi:Flp pilus assembly protein TadG